MKKDNTIFRFTIHKMQKQNKMEKLTLEELAIAFTYDYSLQYFDDEREILHNDCKIIELRKEEMTIGNGEYEYEVGFDDVYIIAKPLSALIDNILDDGNDANYNLHNELCDLINASDCTHFVKALIENKYYAVDVRLWKDIEKWFNKNHFDWKFNLIGQQKAININTINLK